MLAISVAGMVVVMNGFSSITVPLALLFMSNRTLNPALVLIEVPLNAYVLWVNRDVLPHIWRRFLPLIVGLLPGVIVGTLLKIGIWFLLKLTGGEPLLLMWFAIPVWMVTNAYFMWWAFAWYAQYRTMLDTTEVITPARFADSRARLEPLY